jgi:hypothetical protein
MNLRLFYAHVEYTDCPWKGMASEVNFSTFKAKTQRVTGITSRLRPRQLNGFESRYDAAARPFDWRYVAVVPRTSQPTPPGGLGRTPQIACTTASFKFQRGHAR